MNLEDYTWHALYCPPQRELRVAHDLSSRGMPAIVPAEKQWRKAKSRVAGHSDHTKITYRALMPRYVFTGFREAPNWEHIRKVVPLVQGYLQFGGSGPTKLRLADVQWLNDLAEAYRGRQRPTVVEGVIRIGDKVKVLHGPFSGHSVTVDKIVADRIQTLREFLGAPRLFTFALADLVRV